MWNTVSHLVVSAHRLCRLKIGDVLGEESLQACIFLKIVKYADYFKEIFLIKRWSEAESFTYKSKVYYTYY